MNICLTQYLVGAYYGQGTPVPIPNTVVKLIRAENTRMATSRKNRSAPTQQKELFQKKSSFCVIYDYEHFARTSFVVGRGFISRRFLCFLFIIFGGSKPPPYDICEYHFCYAKIPLRRRRDISCFTCLFYLFLICGCDG